eukprot:gene10084-biopygen3466
MGEVADQNGLEFSAELCDAAATHRPIANATGAAANATGAAANSTGGAANSTGGVANSTGAAAN